MKLTRTIAELRELLAAPRREGRTIGLIATMGAFHEGHLTLMRRMRAECDVAVVSLFVNPLQFAAGEDFDTYPRDEARDAELAAGTGIDVLFAPDVEEMYPGGPAAFRTNVAVAGVSERLCGENRPGHFDGITTVFAKLFNIVGPDATYLGQKDAVQVACVSRMIRDLDFPVRAVVCDTVREPDGLAMSSRNAYLGAEDRARALGLSRALEAARRTAAGGGAAGAVARAARDALAPYGVEPEYLSVVDRETLEPVDRVDGEALVALAARVGPARLIDNAVVRADVELA